jgi:gliding motility-associated protein GldC
MDDTKLNYSIITIKVGLNEQGLPEDIQWKATGSGMENVNYSKAFLLSMWDRKEGTTFRVDLWTKDMLVDEMKRFFYETLVTMSDTYERATNDKDVTADMKKFCEVFGKKSGVLEDN